MSDLCWVNGRLASAHDPPAHADDEPETPGCFTTARWTGTGIRFEAHHLARLVRDAAGLGIGAVDAGQARRALRELGRAAFGESPGIVRLQANRSRDGRVALAARTRALGPEPAVWRAIRLPLAHGGPAPFAGAKTSDRRLYRLAAERVARTGMDEGLLFDADDRLVEGTRTNLVAVVRDGAACVPPPERGAVAGVALAIACEARAGLVRRDVLRAELSELRELVALNAVRGAVPIVELDGRPVGDGRPGPTAARLAASLDAAAQPASSGGAGGRVGRGRSNR